MHDIAQRVSKLEVQGNNPEVTKLQRAISKHEQESVACRVMFVGFSASQTDEERIDAITEFLDKNCPSRFVEDFGTFEKGPRGNRTRSSVTYVDFKNPSTAKRVLSTCREKEFLLGSSSVKVRPPRTPTQLDRNKQLKDQETTLKRANPSATVAINWRDRVVTVNGAVAFQQGKFSSSSATADASMHD